MEEQAVAKKDDLRSLISSDQAKKQFALALPKHLKPDRFVRIALTAMNKNPKLLQCTKQSLLACLMDCSSLGLEPDGRKAHLIPYGDKCTLIIDYKGLVDLARRSGEIADIHADVVYENDDFCYSFGTESKLVHKPCLKSRGKAIASYSFVRLKDGSSSYEVMNVEEVEAIHKRSKAGTSGPWVTDWAEMAKKTVFRRHSKWLPVSAEFQEAVEKDYDVPIDITAKPDVDKPEELAPEDLAQPEAVAEEVKAPEEAKEVADFRKSNGLLSKEQEEVINKLKGKLGKNQQGEFLNKLGSDYGVSDVCELKEKDAAEIIKKLEKVVDKKNANNL